MSSKHSLSGRLFVGIDKGKRRISRYAPSFFSIVQSAGHAAYRMEQNLNLIAQERLRQPLLTANHMQGNLNLIAPERLRQLPASDSAAGSPTDDRLDRSQD